MLNIGAKSAIFLIVLGVIVYGIRGSGSEAQQWKAAFVMLSVIAVLLVAQGVRSFWIARRHGDDDKERE